MMLRGMKSKAFVFMAAAIAAGADEAAVTLDGTVLTLGPQTSAVLR